MRSSKSIEKITKAESQISRVEQAEATEYANSHFLKVQRKLSEAKQLVIERRYAKASLKADEAMVDAELAEVNDSHRRADAVKEALISMGIDSNRIQTKGYGAQYAVTENNTQAGRQLNRRVEIVISDERGTLTARRPIQ